MSRINSNIQLWYGTASSASLLTSKFVTGLTSFNTILMTSLFVTLSKTMGFYKDVFLILVYSKLYALLSFPRQMHQLESYIYCFLCSQNKTKYLVMMLQQTPWYPSYGRWATIKTEIYLIKCRTFGTRVVNCEK